MEIGNIVRGPIIPRHHTAEDLNGAGTIFVLEYLYRCLSEVLVGLTTIAHCIGHQRAHCLYTVMDPRQPRSAELSEVAEPIYTRLLQERLCHRLVDVCVVGGS